jgi:hypothetical protein
MNGVYMGTIQVPSNDPVQPSVMVNITAAKNP